MKKQLQNLLSKPKQIIPIIAVVVFALTAIAYGHIGNPPTIPASLGETANNTTIVSGNNVSLSFANSGRVESVLVKQGDTVKAGETLATLSVPAAEGAVNQAKGALNLAQAQYVSLQEQYTTTKAQQNLIVENDYRTLLSQGLQAIPNIQDANIPIITGTYTCDKEGSYILTPYSSSDSDTGFSMNYSGLETGNAGVKYDNPVPLGNCGLQVQFTHATNFNQNTVWTIAIQNVKSNAYLVNKNAYDLAVNNRSKVLSDLQTQIGDSNGNGGVAKAQVDAAQGAYQMAVGAYQNDVIVSPVNGTVTFIDTNLVIGQSVVAGNPVISISQQ